MIKKLRILTLLLIAPILLISQDVKIDSLEKLLDTNNDSLKIQILRNIYKLYEKQDIEKGKKYLDQAYELSKEFGNTGLECGVLTSFGNYYQLTGDYDKAIEIYTNACELAKQTGHINDIATSYNNMGAAYEKKGDYENSMKYLIQALELYEKANDTVRIGKAFLNLGLLQFRQQNYSKSMEYYQKSLLIKGKINDKDGIATLYNNMAILNYYTGDYDNVRNYFEKAYHIYLETGNLRSQSMALSNLAEVFNMLGQKDIALSYYFKVLEVEKMMKNRGEIIVTYQNIGSLFLSRKNYKKASEYLHLALELSFETKSKINIRNIYNILSELYASQEDFKNAYFNMKLFTDYADSINKENNIKQIAELETKYETKKKEQEILLLKNEREIKDLKLKKQRIFTLFLLLGFISISLFLYVIITQNRRVKAAHSQLAYQKNQITDSIEYASKIQQAVLPPNEYIDQILPNHFIMYRPRDIVSGDFYWITNVCDKIVVAAVDCTGHGVPGAFMSMLGFSLLNEIVGDLDEVEANVILDKLRYKVKKALHQNSEETETKDGMDIALCVIDNLNMKLQFAGAYNPLILIRDNELKDIKGDRMPIGIHTKDNVAFTNNEIDIKEGDLIYMFSDGFIDQFGGEHGRKFKLLPFKELLMAAALQPIEHQKEFLEATFDTWKLNHEQVDDVLVIGIRI